MALKGAMVERAVLKLLEGQRFRAYNAPKNSGLAQLADKYSDAGIRPQTKDRKLLRGLKYKTIMDDLRGLQRKPYVMLHFSSVKGKIGVNPRSSFKTPIGVYSYILTPGSYKDLEKGTYKEISDFAVDRAYIHVTRVKKRFRKNILLVNKSGDATSYGERDFQDDLLKLAAMALEGKVIKKKVGETLKTPKAMADRMMYLARNAGINTPVGRIWYLTKVLSKNIVNWSKILRSIGIFGVFDYGSGLIHSNEPYQAVMLRGDMVETVASDYNPRISRTKAVGLGDMESVRGEMQRILAALPRQLKSRDLDLVFDPYGNGDLDIQLQHGGESLLATHVDVSYTVQGDVSITVSGVGAGEHPYIEDFDSELNIPTGSPRKVLNGLAQRINKFFQKQVKWAKKLVSAKSHLNVLDSGLMSFRETMVVGKRLTLRDHLRLINGPHSNYMIGAGQLKAIVLGFPGVNVTVGFKVSDDFKKVTVILRADKSADLNEKVEGMSKTFSLDSKTKLVDAMRYFAYDLIEVLEEFFGVGYS
jgi:hypothetical protein